ncbi:anaerobic C4-dicarboxylate transporter DcuA/anaerobic C4-dicarboxylate transporter DcuB [Salipaludibacillus aurantiacus]|uniref:Anaerobic C4-dicarboxylate transporter DcuA/anaerobic C4-dicarboxylate transporter DcuB n=1 Tax=Salipaludibacillus aurantiacus TaxID=1601833 RepID=A0A1H9SGN3_9BACI|nr:anaerobic C4-dicarboxylate transporter DcuA/anaerobic C4-dicarboxylate transporter DcuB [Salipaludibacillus aurantiacus]
MSQLFWLQFLVVIIAIFIGARIGGIGLGVMGGVGLAILTFGFGLQPTAPPIDVMLMIVAVITAAGALQAAGGMNFLVTLAEKALRRNPGRITFMAPVVTYFFTFFAGTGHVAYTLLPVISEVAQESKVRPERPMSIAVIASQQAITASPISAATVALLALLSPYDITLLQILGVTIPATFIGIMVAAFTIRKRGAELDEDPEYNRRLEEGLAPIKNEREKMVITGLSKLSVALFMFGAVLIVLLGSFPEMRPAWNVEGEIEQLSMPFAIQIIMLTVAALIILICKADVQNVAGGTVFRAGIVAVVAIFGIAWMGDTFFQANMDTIEPAVQGMVSAAPWIFALALFIMSILLNSQAATVRALMPLGLSLGINPLFLIAMFPAVNGYFFIPNYGPIIAAISFDRTGTTKIGKYVLNHSFMLPGLVTSVVAVALGFLFVMFL